MRVLVCGGAGYIGSHMVKLLAENGHHVTTYDNLSTGHREAVKWGAFIHGDILDAKTLGTALAQGFDAVMHFSARSLVGESVTDPGLYYLNNVVGTHTLLEQMRVHGPNRFIFSSTAATYGIPQTDLIDETHPQQPINPYGHSKRMVEQMLKDYHAAYGVDSVSLRYFNAAGADPSGEIGESHNPETHLIPNMLRSALGLQPRLKVFGDDYPTRDGTCIRDYIHVNDLCSAHLAAIHFLDQHNGAHAFNLGNGQGFSILEVINAARRVTGTPIEFDVAPRRAGDPPILVAKSARAQSDLGWRPQAADIETIIDTAWRWHRNAAF